MKDKEAWHAAVHRVTKSQTQLSDWTTTTKQLINNVMLVSGVQQSDSALHIHVTILFQILFPFRLWQSIEQSSLLHSAGPCWLSTLNIAGVYVLIANSQFQDNRGIFWSPKGEKHIAKWCTQNEWPWKADPSALGKPGEMSIRRKHWLCASTLFYEDDSLEKS